jgi:hypothetical protein
MAVASEEDEFWFAVAEQQDKQPAASMDTDAPAPNFTIASKKKFNKAAVREADAMMWYGGDHEEDKTETVRHTTTTVHSLRA